MEKQILDMLHRMQKDLNEIKTDVGGLKTDMSNMKTDMSNMKTEISELKIKVDKINNVVADVFETLELLTMDNSHKIIKTQCQIKRLSNGLTCQIEDNTIEIEKMKLEKH